MAVATYKGNSTSEEIIEKCGSNAENKIYFITGANAGIGFVTAKWLLKANATVLMGCRNVNRAETARQKLVEEIGVEETKVKIIQMDLSDLQSMQHIPETLQQLHITHLDGLVNNAGVMFIPTYQESAQGYEMQWAVNHLGHFHLTQLLLPFLQAAQSGRVVTVSSQNHKMWASSKNNLVRAIYPQEEANYSSKIAYGDSKICNILFTNQLIEEYPNLHAYSLHPGWITGSDLERHLKDSFGMFAPLFTGSVKVIRFCGKYLSNDVKTLEQGAATSLVCLLEDTEYLVNGGYYQDCKLSSARSDLTADLAKALWNISMGKIENFLT